MRARSVNRPVAWLVALVVLAAACTRPDRIVPSDLRSFTSDACSQFPEGTPSEPRLWCRCCVEHDKAYWQGGTRDERHAADEALRQCVAATGEPRIAGLMLLGVSVGGTPYVPTSYRWGYGWPFLRGYRALSAEERAAVARRLAEPGVPAVEQAACR
jgi:hypothetical protein